MGTGIPQEAIGASAAVLSYSFLCLILVTLLICMLWTYGERWTYVTFLAEFSALSTLGSIAQQIHFNRDWLIVKQDDYETALKAVDLPALGLSGVGNEVDLTLFTIQFYSYNVMALMVLFWAVKLFCGSWEIRANFLGSWMRENISLISKIFAVIMPGILVGVGKAPAVLKSPGATFILTNLTMLVSLSIGSILMILILYKYIKTRRLLFAHDKRNGWWGSSGAATATDTTGTCAVNGSGITNDNSKASRRSLYDRALITRFTIGFVILLVLEVALIIFSLYSAKNFQKLAKSSSPDFAVSSCIIDIVLFIPGVSTSFLVFLVFGTNKSPKQYKDLVVSVCGRRTKFPKSKRRGVMASGDEEQGTEFQRLPSVCTKVLTLTPQEPAVVEAKTRGMLFDQRTSIGTQYTTYTTQTGKSRPGSSVHTHTRTLSPTTSSFNFSHPASAKNEFRSVISKEERDAGEAWARQNDLEIGLALEQKWTGHAFARDRDSVGNLTAGNAMSHGDLGSMPPRNFLLDDSDEHEGWTR
ncbi:9c1bf90e-de70-4607-976d-dff0b9741d74 [Sclerotinia trifoliorum]|uniref:9c1bf90e-de70-4607-976d-dff0b9741d74 n=1 Tax=Sclerotinia trifoliorum TaxID=28548 RepID=A0A8H2VTP3_9HELO|nr:9c1bf90e-de70-4607-976d-dff0b9741d74 [Sclerotinia trifoliorum]